MIRDTTRYTILDSPLGPVSIEATSDGITRITLRKGDGAEPVTEGAQRDDDDPVLQQAVEQLRAYFAGDREAFDLPLAPAGTAFQQEVWAALRTIPYGHTWSYRQLAEAIGRPTASRAVGAANGRNPLPIVVPCHRVIGADGSLTGFRGGVRFKRALLALEGSSLPLDQGRARSPV